LRVESIMPSPDEVSSECAIGQSTASETLSACPTNTLGFQFVEEPVRDGAPNPNTQLGGAFFTVSAASYIRAAERPKVSPLRGGQRHRGLAGSMRLRFLLIGVHPQSEVLIETAEGGIPP